MRAVLCVGITTVSFASLAFAADSSPAPAVAIDTARGDQMIAAYFKTETAQVAEQCLRDIRTLDDWTSRRGEYRRQLQEMLGLDPWPERTELLPVVTGKLEHDEFTVENLYFQSRPGLYVTGNLYVPKNLSGPAPTILYVCGHSLAVENKISLGNKTAYQHHGAWFARNGYVCLVIDTLQLGEIRGDHYGTYNLKQFWWNARGYTPAGVEAWNSIRALDYLETRPEVDRERFGVTGRSGGGAYSWWLAALDDRIKAAVPVAGITDLENYVVDGAVEGHCDCMFMLNTYRWDYPLVAALVAPRPLLISNTDKDRIFPLDGVVRLHEKVRRIYRLYGAEAKLGLQITEGPHKDTQELRIHAFRWFNRFLKNDTESLVEKTAVDFFPRSRLRVFDQVPSDEINTRIQESFTQTAAAPEVPADAGAWAAQRDAWRKQLREKVFRGWPDEPACPLEMREAFAAEAQGIRLAAYDFTSEHDIRLRLFVAHRAGLKPAELEVVVLNALDQQDWNEWLAAMRPTFAEQLRDEQLPAADDALFQQTKKTLETQKWCLAQIAPRGVGPTIWSQDTRKQTHIRRRFQLLGQTLDGMRVWDVRRAAQALRSVDGFAAVGLWLQGERDMAGIALYASLYEPDIKRVDLWRLAASHRDGPDFLNVLRFLDVPQAVALAAERSQVVLYQTDPADWNYPRETAKRLGWGEKRVQIRAMLEARPKNLAR